MIRSTKHIFAIAILAFSFMSIMRCEDTQASAEGKPQTAVDYRQKTLTRFVAEGDVTGFKNMYKTFTNMKWDAPNRKTTLQALAITAQEVKEKLEQELTDMGDTQVNKRTLTKGVAQTIGGLYGIGMALYAGMYYYTLTRGQITEIDTSISGNILKSPLIPIVKYPKTMFEKVIVPSMEKLNIADYNWFFGFIKKPDNGLTDAQAKRYLTLIINGTIILPAIISTLLHWYGIKNIKNGWNYKAYLEQQIKNIDEINEYIQAQATLK